MWGSDMHIETQQPIVIQLFAGNPGRTLSVQTPIQVIQQLLPFRKYYIHQRPIICTSHPPPDHLVTLEAIPLHLAASNYDPRAIGVTDAGLIRMDCTNRLDQDIIRPQWQHNQQGRALQPVEDMVPMVLDVDNSAGLGRILERIRVEAGSAGRCFGSREVVPEHKMWGSLEQGGEYRVGALCWRPIVSSLKGENDPLGGMHATVRLG